MKHPAPADIPEHLIDPRTGTLRFCPASVDFVVARLQADPKASLEEALRGLEPLFEFIFQNLNFSSVSFISADLRGMNFSGARFVGAKFDQAEICGAIFRGAEVTRAALARARDWPEAVAQSLAASLETMGTARRLPMMSAPRHGPWAVFSEAHHLPELVLLPPDLPVDDLDPDSSVSLREGRLAIGLKPVTRLELQLLQPVAEAIASTRQGWSAPNQGAMASAKAGLDQALEYLTVLNHMAHPRYTLPSAGLLDAVRRAAKDGKAPITFSDDDEFARERRGAWQVAHRNRVPVPAEPSVSFDEHPFRVMRIFESAAQ